MRPRPSARCAPDAKKDQQDGGSGLRRGKQWSNLLGRSGGRLGTPPAALPSPIGARDGTGVGASGALLPGLMQYGRPTAYPPGPPAVYPDGCSRPIAPPPSVPGSLQAENYAPYVAPRFGGNNYPMLGSVGHNLYQGSALAAMGALPGGFTHVSVLPPPSSNLLYGPSDGNNRAASGRTEGTLAHPAVYTTGTPAAFGLPPTASTGRVVHLSRNKDSTFSSMETHSQRRAPLR